MKLEFVTQSGSWRYVADAARTTVGKEAGTGEPSDKWKYHMLLAEHSPIRKLVFSWKWIDIPYWVSVHFTRHKIGIEHFVSTQRTDRTGVNRDDLPQGALVDHECIANAQAIISISRKRLCMGASKETRNAWIELLKEIYDMDKQLWDVCVPECIYRGFCAEPKSCGYIETLQGKELLKQYRDLIS